tara:strand:+ start:941 stop:1114 length:174 start_codon:yes stop_codon:yes gene_type:complete
MSIENLINDLASGDTAKAKASFDLALGDKVSGALDAQKIEIASNMYGNTEAEIDKEL